MSINALRSPILTPHIWRELAMHLRNRGSTLTLEQAATVAIRAWIAANPPRFPPPAPAADQPPPPPPPLAEPPTALGYQWKSLFLPDGTDLRMSTRDDTAHARVCGDHIIYQGRRISPRGLTLALAGDGRNAWRDVWLRMPGEIDFKPASLCRMEHDRMESGKQVPPYPLRSPFEAVKPPAPATEARSAQSPPPAQTGPAAHDDSARDPLAEVAAAMSASLTAMLELMERIKAEREQADAGPKHGRGRPHKQVIRPAFVDSDSEVFLPTIEVHKSTKPRKSAVTKSRQNDDVKDKPYLAGLLKSGRFSDAQSLFRAADLPVSDFYKQLAWEIDKGHILDNAEELKAA